MSSDDIVPMSTPAVGSPEHLEQIANYLTAVVTVNVGAFFHTRQLDSEQRVAIGRLLAPIVCDLMTDAADLATVYTATGIANIIDQEATP